jgi:phenylpropionate dioxygenase-like ring-hydroxylating dioxygenase large terminal subunit
MSTRLAVPRLGFGEDLMSIVEKAPGIERHPAITYEQILERDSRPVPAHLREAAVPDLGTDPIAVSRYVDPAFARLEEQHLWPRIWQMACREEEIPAAGDMVVYRVAGRSLLVVRQQDGRIRAFHNSCLHRGRMLATAAGHKREIRCPFHGMAWQIDGSFKHNPVEWDFPHWRGRNMSLPQAKVDTWGGFVFVNMDVNAIALDAVLGPLKDHLDRYQLEESYIALHVQKKVRCNWKVAAEAFMESHHAVATHPQLLGYLADVNSQYDVLSDHITRQFSAGMVPSPFVERELTENEIVQAMVKADSRGVANAVAALEVPAGKTAREFMADVNRQALAKTDGIDYSSGSDAEMVDALLYNLFPNISFWAGYGPKLFYRWRPDGRDHDSAIMDIYFLKRVPQGTARPKPAAVFEMGLDDGMLEHGPKAGMSQGLSMVFEQDMRNLPLVQEGMKSSATGVVHFGRYTEMRIRLMHKMIDRYIEAGVSERPALGSD